MTNIDDFRAVAEEVREVSGGLLVGFKLSVQRIEDDIAGHRVSRNARVPHQQLSGRNRDAAKRA